MEDQTIMTEFGAIRPNGKNPRTITAEAMALLCESIRRDPEFMRLRPVIIGADNVVLGGNQRFAACYKLGMRDLPAGWVVKAGNLTPDQLRRFVIVDNAPEGMSGQWDFGALSEDWDKSDLADLGFDAVILDKVFDIPAENGRIDEAALEETSHECPKCGFKW